MSTDPQDKANDSTADDDGGTQRVVAYFSGRVQGVGFRATTRDVGRGFDIKGTVRNMPDGRVEIIAEGDRAELDAFLEKLAGRMSSYWSEKTTDFRPATGEFDDQRTGIEVRR